MADLKKVLVITYYWPPAGGPGVQRWLKFVKYLKEFEIEPIVFIPENPSYPLLDEGLLREVPEDLTIYKLPITEPYKLASVFSKKGTKTMSKGLIRQKEQSFAERMLLWVRGNIFIPDARKLWVSPSVKYLKKIIREEGVAVVITTGPPHSLHLIGMQLKQQLKVSWIADFRDPWTTIGYHEKLKLGKRARKRHELLEREVLQQANVVLATSKTTANDLESIGQRPVETITNGFDTNDVTDQQPEDAFCLSHIGSLLSGRDPKILWEALGELVEEVDGFKDQLLIKLVGAVSEDVLGSIEKAGLSPFLEVYDYVPHKEALKMQRQARVLLLLEIDSSITRGIIPGKLFEYMAAGRPILAVGPEQWEVGEILRETGAGKAYTYAEKTEVKEAVLTWYQQYLEGSGDVQKSNIEKYTRRSLTETLAKIIHEL